MNRHWRCSQWCCCSSAWIKFKNFKLQFKFVSMSMKTAYTGALRTFDSALEYFAYVETSLLLVEGCKIYTHDRDLNIWTGRDLCCVTPALTRGLGFCGPIRRTILINLVAIKVKQSALRTGSIIWIPMGSFFCSTILSAHLFKVTLGLKRERNARCWRMFRPVADPRIAELGGRIPRIWGLFWCSVTNTLCCESRV